MNTTAPFVKSELTRQVITRRGPVCFINALMHIILIGRGALNC